MQRAQTPFYVFVHYHLLWAVWDQFTNTCLAHLLHDDLQDLKQMGLNGIVSCRRSFRVFYPSGLAMTALAEALWDPDVS